MVDFPAIVTLSAFFGRKFVGSIQKKGEMILEPNGIQPEIIG